MTPRGESMREKRSPEAILAARALEADALPTLRMGRTTVNGRAGVALPMTL